MLTKPGRIPCVVPGCRRTADAAKYPPRTQIMCGKHWRGLTRQDRADFRVARKSHGRLVEVINARDGKFLEGEIRAMVQHEDTINRIWSLAIERALGI